MINPTSKNELIRIIENMSENEPLKVKWKRKTYGEKKYFTQ